MAAIVPATDVHEPEPAKGRPTRRKLMFFERTRILSLLAVVWGVLFWREVDSNPLESLSDALRETSNRFWWIEVLFVVEVLRQLHYFLSERSPRWHHFVTVTVFGRWDRFVERRNDWTRYRAGRLSKLVLFIVVVGFLFGAIWHVPPWQAALEAPSRLFDFLFSVGGQLPFILQIAMSMVVLIGQFVLLFWFLSRGGVEVFRPEEIRERFTDVKGQEPVLREVTECVRFLEHPREIEARGGRVPKGILLWGPPGTGKTLMAKAVAGETSKPFVFVEPGAFINMFLGIGVIKVKSLYRKIRKLALRYGGVIVFFDEADALGSRGGSVANAETGLAPGMSRFDLGCAHWVGPGAQRILRDDLLSAPSQSEGAATRSGIRGIIMGGMNGGGGMGTVQALLTEMDGLNKPRGWLNRHLRRALTMTPKPPLKYRILHMMATNLPDALDPAFLRPGRIDRIYHVGRPRSQGREQTYRYYLAKIRHCLTDDEIHRLAVISDLGTGASIADIVNESVIVAMRNKHDIVTYQDVLRARYLKEHGPADDFGYTDWEGHAVAIHEACHAMAMYRLLKRDMIDVATIERRGDIGGFVAPVPLEEQFVSWRSELEGDVVTFLASLAGERMFFGEDNSQGVGGDLRASTMIVLRSMAYHGMGETIVSNGVSLGMLKGIPSGEDGTDRQLLETDLGRRVDAKLQELLGRARTLLEAERHNVLAVAHALETHKTISGEDIIAIIEGTLGPTVDGALYDDPVIRAELETYHAAVLLAMQEQGRVLHPLPVVSPVVTLAAAQLPVFTNGANGSGNGSGNGAGHGPDPYGYPDGPPTVPGGVAFPPPKVPPTPPPAARPAPPPPEDAEDGPAEPAG